MTPFKRRALLPAAAVAAVAALTATSLAGPGSPATAAERPTLAAAVPAWAHGAHATVADDSDVAFVVQLTGRDEAGLHALASRVSDPTSAAHGHYLTHAQLLARYAPTPDAVRTITSSLKAAGLTVSAVSPARSFVSVHGPASSVASLFGTGFGRFRHDGMSLRAPLSTPVLPAAWSGLVSNVAGLAQSAPLTPDASPSTAFVNARPCSRYYGEKTATKQPRYLHQKQAYAICGYTGQQLRKAYGLDKTGLTGKGATVGIVDAYASPTILQDADKYATKHGDKAFRSGQYVEHVPPGEMQIPEDPSGLLLDPQGWYGEQTLDVEAVHAMAPDARVSYWSATSPYGPALYMALSQSVESGEVQIVSNSYGTGSDSPDPTDKAMFDQITDEAAASGVTIDFSSGDSGDETDPSAAGERTADFPATSPGVTAVGGTTLGVGKGGTYLGEVYWGTTKTPLSSHRKWLYGQKTFSGAGGGGVSTSYAEPKWQRNVVPHNLATYGGVPAGRVVPDVSMDADSTTGFLVGQTETFSNGDVRYGEYRIGGTSLSCPLFSGVLALAVQKRHGKGMGLVTPSLYRSSQNPRSIVKHFRNPTKVPVSSKTHQTELANVRPDYTDPSNPQSKVTYSLRTLGNLATLHAYKGYDDSTGLGSPRVGPIISLLAAKGQH